MTPLLAGLARDVRAWPSALLAVPLLRDRGPIERLGRAGGAAARGGGLAAAAALRVAGGPPRPALAPRIRASRRESIGRRLDLAGRPAGLTVQRFAAQGGAGLLARRRLRCSRAARLLAAARRSLAAGVGWFAPDIWVSRAGPAAPGAHRARPAGLPRHPRRDGPRRPRLPALARARGRGARRAGGGGDADRAAPDGARGEPPRAFEALRERNASEQLSSFVAAQLQAEELGVPLSEALNDIAADMAARRTSRPPPGRPRGAAREPGRDVADRAGDDDPDHRLDRARIGAHQVRHLPVAPEGILSAATAARAAGWSLRAS